MTALGSGVDGAARRIATEYNVLGRREKISSYDNPTVGSGSIVNEVQFVYDDFGQLVTEYQEHGGAVNTGTSLNVEYSYADGSSNTIRLTKMTYPDGRELNYDYGSADSTDDALSRVASLIDDDGSTHLVDYSYLGAGAIVQTDYAQPDVRCDLAHGAGNDPYDGPMDRFGRVTDLLWYDYGASADLLRFKHGYDRASNRLYREEADTSDLDQLYSYDDVRRLVQSEEGTLSVGKDSISSLNFAQQWSLDATGNWSGFKEDDDGDATWDLEQTRTSNAVNEITDVAETTGPSWITPAYNRAGNMTTIPQLGDPTQSYAATYDAWNRLVKLEEGEDTVAEYVFDGVKRLVVRKKYVSGSLSQTRHFYHTAGWQTIEERLESGGSILSTADRQFTWGRRYIDDLVCRTVNSVHDYAYQDPNWNVILSSSALARVVYQPYGQIRSTCPATQGDLDAWQHYFAGYRRDEDTGLYLVRHRVYQAELGCWVQRDPIGYRGGRLNLTAYSRLRPTTEIDPFGLKSFIETWWCLENLCCCLAALDATDIARREMLTRYPRGNGRIHDGTVENAVQHCVWMCLIMNFGGCSKDQAKSLGLAHERATPNNRGQHRGMDLYNNSVGIAIGLRLRARAGHGLLEGSRRIEDCFSGCEHAAAGYELYWWKHVGGDGPRNGLPDDFPGFEVDGDGNITGGSPGEPSDSPPAFS